MRQKANAASKQINEWAFILLTAYIAFITYRLFFYAYTDNIRHTMEEFRYNLIPFKTILNYLVNRQSVGFDTWVYNLAGNIAAFSPLGLLLPAAFYKLRNLKYTFITAFLMIFFAEAAQLATFRGVFDIDDLILNLIGVIIGYTIYEFYRKVVKT